MEKVLREIADAIRNALLGQTVVTGVRAIGTVYQNTTGRAIFVSVTAQGTLGNNLSALTDGANPPTTTVKYVTAAVTNYGIPLDFIVLPGSYYKVTFPTGSLQVWTEWRI